MNTLTETLNHLAGTIAERRYADPEDSYVARLFKKGRKKIAQKVGEEAVEVAIAAVSESREELVKESSDLLFHLLILWNDAGIAPEDVAAELEKRSGISGIAEKKKRL